MDLYSIKTIKELLSQHNAAPKDRLGQNFLLEKRVAAKMLGAAEISQKDVVLEIGPGIGTLTCELAANAGKVVAVEKDPAMIDILKQATKNLSNIEIVQGDALKLNLTELSLVRLSSQLNRTKLKVVANLPYYITSPVLRMFLEAENKPQLMVLMMQKEVAQRIVAKPPKMSLLSVSVQFYSTPQIVSFVSKGAFWPRPKVDSAIVKLSPKLSLVKELLSETKFFRVAKAGFRHPRKQLLNNLYKGLSLARTDVEHWLSQSGIDPKQRAETLSVQDWITLSLSLPSN